MGSIQKAYKSFIRCGWVSLMTETLLLNIESNLVLEFIYNLMYLCGEQTWGFSRSLFQSMRFHDLWVWKKILFRLLKLISSSVVLTLKIPISSITRSWVLDSKMWWLFKTWNIWANSLFPRFTCTILRINKTTIKKLEIEHKFYCFFFFFDFCWSCNVVAALVRRLGNYNRTWSTVCRSSARTSLSSKSPALSN